MHGTRLSITGLGLAVFFIGFVFLVKFFGLYGLKPYFLWVMFLPPVSIILAILSLFLRDQIKLLAVLTLIAWAVFFFPDYGPRIIPTFNNVFSMNIPTGTQKLTPMHLYAAKNDVEGLKKHFKGSNIDVKDKGGRTPLITASKNGSLDAVNYLLSNGAEIRAVDNHGQSAFTAALGLKKVNLDMLKILVAHGADVDAFSSYRESQKPIDIACQKGSLELFDFLVDNGADIHREISGGGTLLHEVTDVAIAKKLIEAGVSPLINDYSDNIPLHNWRRSNYAMVEFFIQNGVDVNARNDKGETPLHLHRDLKILELLILFGADVNAQNNNGKTPIQDDRKDNEIILLLLKNGADPFSRISYANQTLLHIATSGELAQFLIDAGLDVNAKDGQGHTPLYYMERYGKDAAEIVIQHGGKKI